VIFFGKAIGNLIFLLIVEVLIVPLFFFIFLSKPALRSAPKFG